MGAQQRTILGVAMGLLVSLGLAASAGAQQQSLTVPMASLNNSGITATATLTDIGGGKVRVEIRTNGTVAGPLPAHLHLASCVTGQLGGPEYRLEDLTNGVSTTEVDATLDKLINAPYAVDLHKSPEELPIYVACGDVMAAAAAAGMGGQAGAPAQLPASGDAGAVIPLASALAGLGLASAGALLRRRLRR
jgi:hypothetical protein